MSVSMIDGHIDYTWPNWISADFRLPDKNGDYLCITSNKTLLVLPFSKVHKAFNAYDSCTKHDLKMSIPVTHWLPLPPLPGED